MASRVIELRGRGARGALGISFDTVPQPGQFLAKAPGTNDRKFVGLSSATPANAVALTDLSGPNGSTLVGYGSRALKDKIDETPSVKDTRFAGGAKGNAIYTASNDTVAGTDDTAAFNAAANLGQIVDVPPGFYRVKQIDCTKSGTIFRLAAGAWIFADPGRYVSNGQGLAALRFNLCSQVGIIGPRRGTCGIRVVGLSEGNGVFFTNCSGKLITRGISILKNPLNNVANKDDTYQTGASCVNDTATNPGGKRSDWDFSDCEIVGFVQYGFQAYGDLTSGKATRNWIEGIGIANDNESRGSGAALTRGVSNFLVIDNDFVNCKEYAVLGSSAGKQSNDNNIDDNRFVNCGRGGASWTEEAPLASVSGVGTARLSIQRNKIRGCGKGQYASGKAGIRAGTYDGVGKINNVWINDNDIEDGTDYDILLQSNADATKALADVNIFRNTLSYGTNAVTSVAISASVVRATHNNYYTGDRAKAIADLQNHWVNITLGAGWTYAFGNPFPQSAYMLDANGYVVIRLQMSGGANGEVFFTLPEGYRPQDYKIFSAGTGRGYIRPDGAMLMSVSDGPVIVDIMFLPYAK